MNKNTEHLLAVDEHKLLSETKISKYVSNHNYRRNSYYEASNSSRLLSGTECQWKDTVNEGATSVPIC